MASKEGWEKVEGAGFWNPEKAGDEVTGVIISQQDGQFGTHYTIKQKDDTEIRTPAHKVLISRMVGFKQGDVVLITYEGEEPPKVRGQNPTKMYSVYRRKA